MKCNLFHISNPAKWLFLIAGILIFIGFAAFAQADSKPEASTLFIEANTHYGFLAAHHPEMWVLTDGYFPTWELSILKQTDGSKSWQYLRNFPQISLSYLHSNFGDSQSLGMMNALMPKIRLPIIQKPHIKLFFTIGLGIALMSKKFDRLDNYQNLAIGSYLNAAVQFDLLLRFTLSQRMRLNTGISLLHISNGTIKSPNYGLNVPTVMVGLSWKITRQKITFIKTETLMENKGKMNLSLMAGVASKQLLSVRDKHFRILNASIVGSRFYNANNKILAGLDVIYDESTRYQLEKDNIAITWTDATKVGISLGHEWTFAQLSMFVNLGYYVRNKNENDNRIYNKMGVNYYVLKHTFVRLALQSHWAKAEFLSLGLGFTI